MYLISYKNNRNKIALTGIGAIFILKKDWNKTSLYNIGCIINGVDGRNFH